MAGKRKECDPVIGYDKAAKIVQGEIHASLVYDPRIKCTMRLQRAAANVADLTMDFQFDKNTCLHLPKDPKDKYLLSLQNYAKEIKVFLLLQNGGVLDIREQQAKLNPEEPSLKRSKTKLFQDK